jgi:hypothetical protein
MHSNKNNNNKKGTTMDTLSWVNLATYKDAGREYLQRSYRDRAAIVATDGHRLHLATAPEIDKPHYVDGFMGHEFVNYDLFNQPLNEAHRKGILQIRKHDRTALKSMARMERNATFSFDRVSRTTEVSLKWEILGASLTKEEKRRGIQRDEVKGKMNATFDAWFFNFGSDEPFKFGLNINYLLDAVIGENPYTLFSAGETAPVYLINEALGHRAVIMPVRLPE